MHIVLWAMLLVILALILISAFFSASETSLMILSRIRLRHMMTRGVRNSKIIYNLISDIDSLIATILVGNNCVNIAISVLITILFIHFFGNTFLIALLSTFVAAGMVLTFGEILPKTFALRNPERIAIEVSPLMKAVVIISKPVTKIFIAIANTVMGIFGMPPKKHSPLVTEEELRLIIEAGKEEGLFGEEQRNMLHRIFEFGTTLVKDVMLPKDKIVGVDITATPEELLNVMAEEGHSRIIVYKDNDLDNIVGLIYVRDVLHVLRNSQLVKIPDLISSPYFVAPEKRVNDLLKDFQRTDVQLAIVRDTAGKTVGMVTIEDLLEEIVGEI